MHKGNEFFLLKVTDHFLLHGQHGLERITGLSISPSGGQCIIDVGNGGYLGKI